MIDVAVVISIVAIFSAIFFIREAVEAMMSIARSAGPAPRNRRVKRT